MGEYFFGEISIGGQVSREQFARMAEIEPMLEGFDPDTLTGRRTGDHGPEVRDGVLYLGDGQASYGEFSDLEAYLQAEGIPYDRHSSGYHEYPAEESSHRPGVGCVTAAARDDGTILAEAVAVLSYIGRGLAIDDLPLPDDGGDAGLALVLMRRGHPLPPFQIVDAE